MGTNKNTIFIDRQGGVIYAEFLVSTILCSLLIIEYFNLKYIYGFISLLPITYCIYRLFFGFFLFRWFFSTVMSLTWAYLSFGIVEILSSDIESRWITGIAVFLFMLWVHRDEYRFESSATVNIFDYKS